MTISGLCALIEKNNEDEHVALKGYFEVLELTEGADFPRIEEFRNRIKEIISDEMNHRNYLDEYAEYYSNIRPASD